MKNKIIEMGDKVRDRITNFEGVEIIQQRANRIKELKTPAKKEELIKK